MSPVERDARWGYLNLDALDGKILEPGEVLLVQFPDDFQLLVKVEVNDTAANPLGSAYTTLDFHGSPLRLELRGLLAERRP